MPVIIAFIAISVFYIGLSVGSKVDTDGISTKDIKIAIVECQRALPRDQECGAKIVTFVKEKEEKKDEET